MAAMTGRKKQNGSLDEQIEESFPASDPPSFMGNEREIGRPVRKKKAPKRGSKSHKAKSRKTKGRKTKRR